MIIDESRISKTVLDLTENCCEGWILCTAKPISGQCSHLNPLKTPRNPRNSENQNWTFSLTLLPWKVFIWLGEYTNIVADRQGKTITVSRKSI